MCDSCDDINQFGVDETNQPIKYLYTYFEGVTDYWSD